MTSVNLVSATHKCTIQWTDCSRLKLNLNHKYLWLLSLSSFIRSSLKLFVCTHHLIALTGVLPQVELKLVATTSQRAHK